MPLIAEKDWPSCLTVHDAVFHMVLKRAVQQMHVQEHGDDCHDAYLELSTQLEEHQRFLQRIMHHIHEFESGVCKICSWKDDNAS